jgi:pyruvate dehydrogenase E2 component (dihydrolipoamide acetyltransferase)
MSKKNVELPEIGEGVTEGELVRWLVKVGDSIKVDQPLAEVLTDKATVEIPSIVNGTVTELNGKEGDIIAVGQTLLVIETSGATAPAKEEVKKQVPAPQQPSQPAAMTAAPAKSVSAPVSSGGLETVHPPVAKSDVLATPSTRRLARELNVDINQLSGTGNAGRVTREDVRSNTGGTGATLAGTPMTSLTRPSNGTYRNFDDERVPLRGIRRKIAEKMQLSKRVIPHFSLLDEANVTELVKMRAQLKDQLKNKDVKITYLPFVMKAVIATAREFNVFNASIDDEAGEIVYHKNFNMGFAADTPNGLVVPVIKNADQKTILQISQEITTLSQKARDGKLAIEDLQGATISITNIGSIGGTYATPIINHPEVAIIGMYKIKKTPIFVGDQIKAADIMNLSCTADHRLIDGAVAAKFLTAMIQRLENPSLLMLDMI